MNVMTISLSGEDVTLRLSAGKLQEFIKSGKNTEQTPLLAVLDALDTLERKAALLTAALQHKGNANKIKNGYDLLDELVDKVLAGEIPDAKTQAAALRAKLMLERGLI